MKLESEEKRLTMISWHTGKEYVLVKPRTVVEVEGITEQEAARLWVNPFMSQASTSN